MVVTLLLLYLSSAQGLRIITRNMIRSPDESRTPTEKEYQPVPLKVPDGRSGNSLRIKSKDETNTTSEQSSDPTPEEWVTRRNRVDLTTTLPLRGEDDQDFTTGTPEAVTKIELKAVNRTTILRPINIQHREKEVRRTQLYPVGRLWPEEERSEADLWSLLHAAYLCLFSGITCFSEKVVPMFRTYIGIDQPFQPPHYLLPRITQVRRSEEDTVGVEEGRRLHRRLLKDLLIGLLLANTALLPWIGGVGLASGKALLTGLLSLGAAGAVAAFPQPNKYYM